MDYQQYNQEQKNLPDFMKDFHDQKDLFKCIQDWAARRETFKDLPNSWADNHVFVIDYFLWFMSIHGYKLQKIKSDIDFCDIHKTVSDFTDKRVKSLSLILQGKKDESQSE